MAAEFVGGVMRDESGQITAIQWANLSPENAHLARFEHLPIGPGHPLGDRASSPPPGSSSGPADAGSGADAAGGGGGGGAGAGDDDDSSGSDGEGAAGEAAGGGGGGGGVASPGSPTWGPEDHEAVTVGKISKSTCQVQGCLTKLVSKKVSMAANAALWMVLIPLRPFKKRSNRHTCRSCKKKVCSAHFCKAPGGMKICAECSAKGVDGPASSN